MLYLKKNSGVEKRLNCCEKKTKKKLTSRVKNLL